MRPPARWPAPSPAVPARRRFARTRRGGLLRCPRTAPRSGCLHGSIHGRACSAASSPRSCCARPRRPTSRRGPPWRTRAAGSGTTEDSTGTSRTRLRMRNTNFASGNRWRSSAVRPRFAGLFRTRARPPPASPCAAHADRPAPTAPVPPRSGASVRFRSVISCIRFGNVTARTGERCDMHATATSSCGRTARRPRCPLAASPEDPSRSTPPATQSRPRRPGFNEAPAKRGGKHAVAKSGTARGNQLQ